MSERQINAVGMRVFLLLMLVWGIAGGMMMVGHAAYMGKFTELHSTLPYTVRKAQMRRQMDELALRVMNGMFFQLGSSDPCPTDDNPSWPATDNVATSPTHCKSIAGTTTPANVATKTVCPASAGSCDFTTIAAAYAASASGWKIVVQTRDTLGHKITYAEQLTLNLNGDNTHWRWLTTDQCAAGIPEGTRTNPSAAGYAAAPFRPTYTAFGGIMSPQILHASGGGSGGVVTTPGSYNRISCFEVATTQGDTNLSGLIQLTGDHNIADRNFINPENTTNGMRGRNCAALMCTQEIGIELAGHYVAAAYNYIWDVRRSMSQAADSKGIDLGNENTGPVAVIGNFVESGDEGIFEGGGACSGVGGDYDIQWNLIFKPLFWKSDCTVALCGVAYDGNNTEVKNGFELKNAQRVRFVYNVLKQNWVGDGDQDGSMVLFTPKNPNGTCTAAAVNDVTMAFNFINGANKGVQLAPVHATQGNTLPAGEARLSIHDNLLDDITWPTWDSNGQGPCCFDAIAFKVGSELTNGDPSFVAIFHNTVIQRSTQSNINGAFLNVTGGVNGIKWTSWYIADNIGAGGISGIGAGGGVGQCINGNGASYITLGEVATPGCMVETNPNAWCMDGNTLTSSTWTGLRSNLPFPNPTGNLTSHPSPNCPLTLVGNTSVTDYTSVGFVRFSATDAGTGKNNYALLSTSAGHNSATNGTDRGADITTLLTNITGVDTGQMSGGTSTTLTITVSPPPNFIASVFMATATYPGTPGSDSNNCSPSAPCLTPQHATTVVDGKGVGQKIVLFHGCPLASPNCGYGTYYVSSAWALTATDTGTVNDRVIYASYPGEVAYISGAKRLTNWTNDGSCGANCNKWHDDETTTVQTDGFFYNGNRRFEPRSTTSYLRNAGPVCAAVSSTNCPAANNGIQGCAGGTFACIDRLKFAGTDIPTSLHNEGIHDPFVYDFEIWTVATMKLAASGGDGTNPCTTTSNVQCLTGRTGTAFSHGFLVDVPSGQGHRYILANGSPEAGDTGFTRVPGTYYIDRCPTTPNCVTPDATTRYYYYADTSLSENPSTNIVEVPQKSQVLTLNRVQYVQFVNIGFEHDNWVVPAAGIPQQQGMPNTTAMISVKDSSHILFDRDIIAHSMGWGIEFVGTQSSQTITTNTVSNSEISDLGAGGIRIGQLTDTNDTVNNTPQFITVTNNRIHGWGRKDPSGIGSGVWLGNTHDDTVLNNEIYDGYSGGVGLGFNLGRDTTGHGCGGAGCIYNNVVGYNLVYTIGQGVMNDMGGVYAATSLSNQCASWSWDAPSETYVGTPCNQVIHNVFKDIVHAWQDNDGFNGNGIYFDQGTSNVLAQFNLILRPSQSGLYNNTSNIPNDVFSQNNWFDNNIIAYPGSTKSNVKEAIHRGGDNPDSFHATRNAFYNNGKNTGTCGSGGKKTTFQNCPGKWSSFDCSGNAVSSTTRWLMDKNLLFDRSGLALDFAQSTPGTPSGICTIGGTTYTYTHATLAQWQSIGQDVNSQNVDPKFVNPTYPTDNYAFSDLTVPALVGMANFDYTQAGLSNPGLIPAALTVVTGFPTNPLNQATDY